MPWRKTRAPYRILISEIMLQQTPVGRVMAKYGEFLRAFPSFPALAKATVREVLAVWKGLGYNRRALALRETAGIIVSKYRGQMPRTVEQLMALPGIGRATACAILVFAFNAPLPFIETNIRKVFLHFFFPGMERVADARIMPLAQESLDTTNPREWHYALMDHGALIGKGGRNPNRRSAHYKRQPAFEGSVRQIRGRVLAAMVELGSATAAQIARAVHEMPRNTAATVSRGILAATVSRGILAATASRGILAATASRGILASRAADTRLDEVLGQLEDEGFLVRKGTRYFFT